jgi:hypothetical protein
VLEISFSWKWSFFARVCEKGGEEEEMFGSEGEIL